MERIRAIRNASTSFGEKHDRKGSQLEGLGINGRIILKFILRK
jgi:hypothetical protein